ncbi:MAG: bifunctional methylenetetrahydrofolate dehydrogenase/methenyltetrahydrofolate cyclohydrolase FolD [Candidatus Sericytochromatia bacterium]|nr:bifunctional methylenetetrahydrofolate dehydrogenase/methenyltetrahydrofolate cyclohydrolase FolD [Candidatus Sericytochromatia bacterium]
MLNGTARCLDGKRLAGEWRARIKARIDGLAPGLRVPCLAVVQVGEDPASQVYVRNKRRACREVGIHSIGIELDASTKLADLTAHLQALNDDPGVDGILLQLPLPPGIDDVTRVGLILPEKDVDGFHPLNVGRLVLGHPGLPACTPAGIMALLQHHQIALAGKRAVVLGRSAIVGKPLASLLLNADATVTVAHSRTSSLESLTREAEILLVAVGRPGFVTPEMVRPGVVVVDVGIHRGADGSLVGDVSPEVADVASWITPVPGGVGPMTIAALLENTWQAFAARFGIS